MNIFNYLKLQIKCLAAGLSPKELNLSSQNIKMQIKIKIN